MAPTEPAHLTTDTPLSPWGLLAAPLTLPCSGPASFFEISDRSRESLKRQRHFLVRGAGWVWDLQIAITQLLEFPVRKHVFRQLKERTEEWSQFLEAWEYERGGEGELGKNLISGYFSHNKAYNPDGIADPTRRYLTLARAAGLVALLDSFLADWISNKAKGAERKKRFMRSLGRSYSPDFISDVMSIEPIIYKHSALSEDQHDAIFEPEVPGSNRARVKDSFLDLFRSRIHLPWDNNLYWPERVVKEIFLEDRCSDFEFMRSVAAITREYLGLPTPPSIRVASNFIGPSHGIINERFVDILRAGPKWQP